MSLYCGCEAEPEPGMTWSWWPDDYTDMPFKSRRSRCADESCRKLLNPGDIVAAFKRFRVPETDIECAIYGDDGEIPMAPQYLCEECADLFFSLTELGYCLSHNEVRSAHQEYKEITK